MARPFADPAMPCQTWRRILSLISESVAASAFFPSSKSSRSSRRPVWGLRDGSHPISASGGIKARI